MVKQTLRFESHAVLDRDIDDFLSTDASSVMLVLFKSICTYWLIIC